MMIDAIFFCFLRDAMRATLFRYAIRLRFDIAFAMLILILLIITYATPLIALCHVMLFLLRRHCCCCLLIRE